MGYSRFTRLLWTATAMLGTSVGQGSTHGIPKVLTAKEITQIVKGKVCITMAGAKLTFGDDGRYSYSGFWQDSGHYSIERGEVSIAFDNGLERSFSVSRIGKILYMEQTVILCGDDISATKPLNSM